MYNRAPLTGFSFRSAAIGAIRVYQAVSRRSWPRMCRFHPTCSQYAIEAIDRFGLGHGSVLAASRLCRCHPFNPGGLDPVPELRNE